MTTLSLLLVTNGIKALKTVSRDSNEMHKPWIHLASLFLVLSLTQGYPLLDDEVRALFADLLFNLLLSGDTFAEMCPLRESLDIL